MSPQVFDRYMVQHGIGRNRKLHGLTDSEFRAHMAGVLSLASQSPVRGYLLIVAGVEVTAEDVANEAGGKVTARVAAAALQKLKDRGVLEWSEEVGAWYVHDWHDLNPGPREDRTNAERQQRFRDRQRNGASNARRNGASNGSVTACNAGEVEVEGEGSVLANARTGRGTVAQVFEAWIASTGRTAQTVLDTKRERVIRNALKLYPVADLLDAVDGWRFSSHHRGENDRHTVYNDLGLLLRDAERIEKFRDLKRAGSNVVALDQQRASRFAHFDEVAGL
ncbi:MAG: hypothetical protein KGL35_09180 [Bradyrhizobium sp.]|nr:hypothetical protein [Bradyrhizobium sp.]